MKNHCRTIMTGLILSKNLTSKSVHFIFLVSTYQYSFPLENDSAFFISNHVKLPECTLVATGFQVAVYLKKFASHRVSQLVVPTRWGCLSQRTAFTQDWRILGVFQAHSLFQIRRIMASPMVTTYGFLVGPVLLLLQTQDAGSFVPLLAFYARVERHNAAAPSEQCPCVRRIPPITAD